MPDPLIASAFVRIKPEPKSVSGFGKEVRATIEKSFLRPVRIKVQPTLLPFKKKIQTELNSSVFTVKVTPVLAPGFKTQVSRLAREAAAGITIPVKPIVPVGAAGAAKPAAAAVARGPALSTAASREAAFQKRLNDLALARAASIRKLTAAEQSEGSVKQKLTAVTSALSKAEGVLETHLKAQDAIETSLTVKQRARLATAIRRAQADVTAATTAKGLLEVTIAQADADLKADLAARSRTDLLLRQAAIETDLVAAMTADELVTGRLAQAKARLSAFSSAAAAATKLNAEAQAIAAATAVDEDIAVAALTKQLEATAVADELRAKAAVKTAIADGEAATAAGVRATREKALGKGLLATALAAAGARGATLAAGFEFLAGAAIATGLFKSVQLATKLQTELNVFRVTAGATATEMDRVSAASKRLGADITLPAVSANDAAEAMTELAKAGLSVNDSIDAARGALQLGTAAQIDNADAVNITASALNAFGLAGTEAIHVADLLAGAANAAQGGIADMGASLSSVASVARQAGVSVEDTVALLTLLAKNGIQGAEAGTALRVAIIRLIAPTDNARKLFEKFNIQVLDAQGNLRPEVFADIAKALDGVGASQRNAALQTIFGTRAIRAQAVIGREGVFGLNEMRDATNQQGAAAELAAARTQGFAGEVEALKNSMATLGETIGEALIPVLGNFVETGTEVVGTLQKIGDAVDKLKKQAPSGDKGGFLDRFLGSAKRGLTSSLGDQLRDINATAELLQKRPREATRVGAVGLPGFGDVIKTTEKLNAELGKTINNADALAVALSNAPPSDKGIVGGEIEVLRKLRDQILGTGEEANAMREKIDAAIRLVTALGRKPTAVELKVLFTKGGVDKAVVDAQNRLNAAKLNIQLGLDKKSVVFLGNSAQEAAAVARQKMEDELKLFLGHDLTPADKAIFAPFFLHAPEAGKDAGKDTATAFKLSFDDEMAIAEASGASLGSQLATARAAAARSQRFFNRIQAEVASGKRPKNDPLLGKAATELNQRNAAAASLAGEITQNSKTAADKITTARNKADQAFLDALGLKRGRLDNAILRAEGSTGLEDDIKTQTALRNFFKKKIDETSKTIKDAQTKAETIQSLTSDLIATNQKIRELNLQLVDSLGEKFQTRINIAAITGSVGSIRKLYAAWIDALQKALAEATKGSKLAQDLKLKILETQQAAFSAINEGFELDIKIAEAQNRPRAAVRARERFIEQLKRERAQFKKGTNEYKRLTLDILEQEAAIKEATGSLKDAQNAAKEQFDFLQKIQGFTGNLLGNLIPGGITGGLVGGAVGAPSGPVSPAEKLRQVSGGFEQPRGISEALNKAQAQKDAVRDRGFSSGQGNRTNHLLMQILAELHKLNRGSDHPEAKKQRKIGSAALDVGSGHGSTHGM